MNIAILLTSSNIQVPVRMIRSRLLDLRAFLVVAALISLCVSNNVGPSFLPLPDLADRLAENPQSNQRDAASRHPSPTESDSFPVPIMGYTQKKRVAKQVQPLDTTLTAGFVPPGYARVAAELSFPVFLLTPASVSQPPGRAPPRLV